MPFRPSRRAFLAAALAALAIGCGSPSAPSSIANTQLSPPATNPAYPGASGSAVHRTVGNQRELEVEVEDVPAGTVLTFFYNDTELGTAVADAQGRARIALNTNDGATVPFRVIGATISVQSEGIVVVSGTF